MTPDGCIVVAYGSVPKDGGTFTFYRNVRGALLDHKIKMRCVTVGAQQAALIEDSYVDDGCVVLASGVKSLKAQAKEFVDWCVRENVDVVIAVNSEPMLSALPHLPQFIRIVGRCANAFDHGYKITLAGGDRVEKIIAPSPRLRSDLVDLYGVNPDKVVMIPNGIDVDKFGGFDTRLNDSLDVIKIGFVGRLEHSQKGVFYLPEIVSEMARAGIPYQLDIVGKGRHERRLRRLLRDSIRQGRTRFHGSIAASEIPRFLSQIDIFAFTSHFEGCPNALLEALCAGCVPISWKIEGITDYLISHGETGFLCELGDVGHFAQMVGELQEDRSMLRMVSDNAALDAAARFGSRETAAAYSKVISDVVSSRASPVSVIPWTRFVPDPNFRHSIWERLPKGVLSAIRRIRDEIRYWR